jgi:uncharacterized protein (DUF3820 family)
MRHRHLSGQAIAMADGAMTHAAEPNEVVPEALRKQLLWDERHDAMARLVADEFKLVLPRDRELIRQLTFIRVQQGEAHVLPFGKHKGRLLEEIFVDDPNYIEWLAAQEWFPSKFPALHAAIIRLDGVEGASADSAL